jgi:hypothetical protein
MMHLLQHAEYSEFGKHCNVAIRFKQKHSKLLFRYRFTTAFLPIIYNLLYCKAKESEKEQSSLIAFLLNPYASIIDYVE